MTTWNIGTFSCLKTPLETLIMSFVCSPCQFGITHAKAHDPEQAAYSYCVAYGFHSYMYYLVALTLTPVPPLTPASAALVASLVSSSAVGAYAGYARTRLRQKYGIEGSSCDDCLLHTFFPQCALAQEAHEVLKREGQSPYIVLTDDSPKSTVDVTYRKLSS
jgi:Cys-rich protein (TIGR01571 family)